MKSHKLGRFRGPRTEGSAGGVCEGKAEEAQRASEHAVFGDRPKDMHSIPSRSSYTPCIYLVQALTHTPISHETLQITCIRSRSLRALQNKSEPIETITSLKRSRGKLSALEI